MRAAAPSFAERHIHQRLHPPRPPFFGPRLNRGQPINTRALHNVAHELDMSF